MLGHEPSCCLDAGYARHGQVHDDDARSQLGRKSDRLFATTGRTDEDEARRTLQRGFQSSANPWVIVDDENRDLPLWFVRSGAACAVSAKPR